MSPTEDDESADVRADGAGASAGARDDSPFNTMSDTSVTRKERYSRIFDTTIMAPLRVAWTDWRARLGIAIVLLYLIMGTVGVVFIEAPVPNEGPRLLGPFQSLEFPLGTNNLGEGLLAQTIHATPAMLKMIASGAIFATAMAAIVGTLSGYKGGFTDRILMTFTDILMTIPGLPLVIVIAVILQPRDPFVVGLVLTVNAWAGLARTVRAQVLTIREEAYVEASRVMGVPTPTIIAKDILPNLMPYIAVNFVQSARGVIFSSVGLYFLGILPFSQANWGVMMNLAYTTGGALYTLDTAHWLIIPMAAIILLSLGLILVAQGADRLFNPRVRARHARTVAGGDEEGPEEEEGTSAATATGGM